ncbi:MAG: D-tyrosyl-tRNA(Tyr) deacylase [Clostridia bacterium]|nr:D-tyrosyl-tRNA(Tyr) deacylase [Clostridia bacterium]
MRAVVQRVVKGEVHISGEKTASIGKGLVVLLGVGGDDTEKDVDYLAEKVANLRIFEDDQGKMNLSCCDIGGEVLVVSQFTLYGDYRKGRRPSFTAAAGPQRANYLYEYFVEKLKEFGIKVETGKFREEMLVEIHNYGPVTMLLDSKKIF